MTVNEMLTELRYEARISADAAHGSHLAARHTALLRRTQEELLISYEWPHLNIIRAATVAAGQRYLAYPAQLDYDGIQHVFAKGTDDEWHELDYGIELEHLNAKDSDADERHPAILRWANYLSAEDTTVSMNMLELWPVPDREVALRFQGRREANPIVNPTDRSVIDGPIIVLHAAAELLAGQKADDASLKLQRAQARYDSLKRRASNTDNRRLNLSATPSRQTGQRFRTPE
jgi:hypothetical protein